MFLFMESESSTRTQVVAVSKIRKGKYRTFKSMCFVVTIQETDFEVTSHWIDFTKPMKLIVL